MNYLSTLANMAEILGVIIVIGGLYFAVLQCGKSGSSVANLQQSSCSGSSVIQSLRKHTKLYFTFRTV